MWNTRMCLCASEAQLQIPIEDQIRLFSETGFDGFFTAWTENCRFLEWKKVADSLGMIFQSLHAPYHNVAAIWNDGPDWEHIYGELMSCAEDCSEAEVPIMVVHAFCGFQDHSPTDSGVEKFRRIAQRAAELGVKMAVENTEGEEYLAALMDGLRDMPNVGFCWDTGHEMCYNHSQDLLKLYGDRLLCTHLNDNLGVRDYFGRTTPYDDLHLLPFEGAADWTELMRRLNRWHYNGPLTFEFKRMNKTGRRSNNIYEAMDPETYVAEAYRSACRVAMLKLRCGE